MLKRLYVGVCINFHMVTHISTNRGHVIIRFHRLVGLKSSHKETKKVTVKKLFVMFLSCSTFANVTWFYIIVMAV